MLPEPVKFEEEITLIMNSGVQFMDFGIRLDPRKEAAGEFADQPGATSLARLEYDDRRDRHVHPGQPDVGVKPLLSVPLEQSLKLLTELWLPVPLLRVGAAGDRFEEGPSNWARARLVALAPGEDPDHHSHRITLACDTRVSAPRKGSDYLSPTTDDIKGGAPFRLAHRAHWMGWFLEKPWIEAWIREVFVENAAARLRMVGEDIDLELASRMHQAHYLNFLHLIGAHARPPRIRILSNATSDQYPPILVDLVLDVGNSRTCGILIESHPQESDGLRKRYELELRDLTHPHQVYAEPFESRIEFAQAMFGKENFSAHSGRSDAFVWPTMARVGREATRLASRRRGTEGSTGVSSPKRYLWDEESYEPGWRLNCAFNRTEAGEPLATAAPFSNLINDLGEVLHELDPAERMPVFTPHYTRSSLMMFMLAEVLSQALMQINSPSQRLKQSHANLPRQLRSITLTVPPSMPKPERDIFRKRITQAMQLVWKCMDWHPLHAEISDESARPFPPFPQIQVEWDEASCGQIVYLFSEIQNNFGGRSDEFFALLRRTDGRPGGERKLTIASIDIGGGTTDLVITDFHLDHGQGLNVFIVPKQRFRDGFKVAGDDILFQVIQEFVVPALASAFKAHGIAQPQSLLSRLIGFETVDARDSTLRQQLALQVLYPIGLRLLKEYENCDPLAPGGPGTLSFGEILGSETASPEVLQYVAGAVRRAVGAGAAPFDLLAIPLEFNLRRIHERFLGDRMDICKTIRALCEVVNTYQCDVLLLTGRPSRLPGIQALFRALLPLPPGRIIPMHDYRTGVWYPFHRQGKVADPKTTAAVGAMLCVLGRGRLPNFFFRADTLRAYSTVRYIGPMDDNNTIKRANEFYREVDLDDDEYELPDQPFEMRGMMRLGFRQIQAERWAGSPLYTLSFADERVRERVYSNGEVLRVRLAQDRVGRRAGNSERFRIASVESDNGQISNKALKLQLNTLANVGISETSYWLDSGSVYRG